MEPPPVTLTIGFSTHVGRKRSNNEDSYAVLRGAELNDKLDALLVVADGMGGTGGGEIASRLVAQTLPETVLETLHTQAPGTLDVTRLLRDAIARANHTVWATRKVERPELKHMGTTCVAGVVQGSLLTLANVGDSRAYLLRGGKLSQLTEDHSEVWQEVKAGRMTREEAQTNRFRNRITRAVGLGPEVKPDVQPINLEEGDSLLLCSDGLFGDVPEPEIARVLASAPDPQAACDRLIRAALEGGGRDNVTLIVARYGAFTPLPSSPEEWIVRENENPDLDTARRTRPGQTLRDDEDEDEPAAGFRDEDEVPEYRPVRRSKRSDHRSERWEREMRFRVGAGIAIAALAIAAMVEGAMLYNAQQGLAAVKPPPPPVVRRTDQPLTYRAPLPLSARTLRPDVLALDSAGEPIVATLSGTLARIGASGDIEPLGSTFPTLSSFTPGHATPTSRPDISTDASGNLYQIDSGSGTLRIYTAGGTRTAAGLGKGVLEAPTRVAVNARGDIFVLSAGHLYRFESLTETEKKAAASPAPGSAMVEQSLQTQLAEENRAAAKQQEEKDRAREQAQRDANRAARRHPSAAH